MLSLQNQAVHIKARHQLRAISGLP